MRKQLKALLDRPSKKSFSILSLVTGNVSMKGRVLEYDELLSNGVILEVIDGPMVDVSTEVALWLGDTFKEDMQYAEEELNVSLLSSLFTSPHEVKGRGSYIIISRSEATKVVNDFLESTVRLVFVHPPSRYGGNVAHLMRWTDPDHKLTRAASLYLLRGRELARKIKWYTILDNVSEEVIRKSAYEVGQEYIK